MRGRENRWADDQVITASTSSPPGNVPYSAPSTGCRRSASAASRCRIQRAGYATSRTRRAGRPAARPRCPSRAASPPQAAHVAGVVVGGHGEDRGAHHRPEPTRVQPAQPRQRRGRFGQCSAIDGQRGHDSSFQSFQVRSPRPPGTCRPRRFARLARRSAVVRSDAAAPGLAASSTRPITAPSTRRAGRCAAERLIRKRDSGRMDARPQPSESVGLEAIVDPPAAPRPGDQPGLTQHPQVIRQQVRRDRHSFLQVAHAALPVAQRGHNRQSHRVGERSDPTRQFSCR